MTVRFLVVARWPGWSEGDVGIYVRQCLQFSLHGRMPPLAVHEKGLRASWDGEEDDGCVLIQGAVRYANRATAKVFPSLYREHGRLFHDVRVDYDAWEGHGDSCNVRWARQDGGCDCGLVVDPLERESKGAVR